MVNAKPGFTTSFALYGLGGVGKTQIAIEYAYLHREDFDIICWLRASDSITLANSYIELSRNSDLILLGSPKFPDQHDNVDIAKEMKSWFERQDGLKWLLIFDNADKITENLADMIPRHGNGCVLTTSRNQESDGELAVGGREVEEMKEAEAIQLLMKRARCEGPEQDSKTLVSILGYLPLAIEQAAGFIRSKKISVARYIAIYETNKSELLRRTPSLSHKIYYHETVATTWKISFAAVEQQDPLASEILRLIAFLDGAKIQMELLQARCEVLDNEWRLSEATDLSIEDALGCLLSYSLVRRLLDDDIAVHLLVQEIVRESSIESASLYFEGALKLVEYQFPWGGDLANLDSCMKYLAQGRSCAKYGIIFETEIYEMHSLLDSLGSFCLAYGQYDEAIAHYERALRIKEAAFGVDHINTADTINNLGITYRHQGKYELAIAQYERALRIKEAAFGVDHINTADTINNLGITYDSQGKYELAIAQYERALRIKEAAFGVDHINTANTINNLGSTYQQSGQVRAGDRAVRTGVEDQRGGIRRGSHQHGRHDQQPRQHVSTSGQVRAGDRAVRTGVEDL